MLIFLHAGRITYHQMYCSLLVSSTAQLLFRYTSNAYEPHDFRSIFADISAMNTWMFFSVHTLMRESFD
jgi:hypothetical protein